MLAFLGSIGGLFGVNPISAGAKAIGGLVLVVVLGALVSVSYCQGRSDGRTGERLETQKKINAALERDRKAREKADAEREADAVRVGETKEALENAIDQAARAGNDPAVALACERLRRLPARLGIRLPPECGPARSNDSQAGSRP